MTEPKIQRSQDDYYELRIQALSAEAARYRHSKNSWRDYAIQKEYEICALKKEINTLITELHRLKNIANINNNTDNRS